MQSQQQIDTLSDARLTQLKNWLSQQPAFRVKTDTLRPASEDASFRRYFRVDTENGDTLIVMDAPPEQENVDPFLQVADLFRQIGVSVPQVLAQDREQGFLLLSDLGTTMYLDQLNADTARQLYTDAIDALLEIQMHSDPDALPEYDRELLLRELMLLPEWYFEKHLGVTLTEEQTATLMQVFNHLLANNLAQPQVYVHRDYHSRNLMVMENGNPGILDFQDAVYGPITYDLVSLLRDAYIQWDEETVIDLVIRYWEGARRIGLPVHPDIDSFYRDFEWMGLQRHIKILGIFARLAYRDNKAAYLEHLPLVLEYTRKTAQRYVELAPLWRLLHELENKPPETGYTF